MDKAIGGGALNVVRFLSFREVIRVITRLSKVDREFVQHRLKMIEKDRCMTLRLAAGNLLPIPKHKMWITRVANSLSLIIVKSIKYDYIL